jgi:predicted component of type VI protein secretion system
MALLIYLEGQAGEAGRVLAFEDSPVRIGRNTLNDLTLSDLLVSQWHAILRFEGMEVSLMDLGSTNGTHINGQRLPAQQPVRVGGPADVMQVGPTRFKLNFGDASLASDYSGGSSFEKKPRLGRATMMVGPSGAPPAMQPGGGAAAGSPSQTPPAYAMQHVMSAVEATRPVFGAYRNAWTQVLQQMRQGLDAAPADVRPTAARAMVRAMPQLAGEPEAIALLKEYGVDTSQFEGPDTRAWLTQLAGQTTSAKNDVHVGLAMERVSALLEAFGESYVELRKGMESFGSEIGLQLASEQTLLHKAQTRADVLAYLLDWQGDGNQRVNDLRRSFADVALHQVAMLNGVMAGTRAVLKELSPDAPADGKSEGSGGLLGFGASAKWSRFKTAHDRLTEGDRFTRVLFGRDFFRAYYAVAGGESDS